MPTFVSPDAYLTINSKGRLLTSTLVGAHWQPKIVSTCITRAHDIVTKYLARNEDVCTLVGKLPQRSWIPLHMTTIRLVTSALWPHLVRVHLENILSFGTRSYIVRELSCHLSCHTHTCLSIVPTNLIVKCTTHTRNATSPRACPLTCATFAQSTSTPCSCNTTNGHRQHLISTQSMPILNHCLLHLLVVQCGGAKL